MGRTKTSHLFKSEDLFELEAEEVQPYTASAAIYDHMMKEVNYPGWARYIILLMKTAGGETRRSKIKGQKLCEFACGTGNISAVLSGMGFEVTGIDSSGEMLEVAGRKLGGRNNGIKLIHHNMVSYSGKEEFEKAVCVYDSMNYISTEEAVGRFFRSVYGSMKPGGMFVFDASLESNSLNDSSLFVQHGKHKGVSYHRKSHYDSSERIHTTRVRIRKDGRVLEEIHREYVYDLDVIRTLFTAAGFEERFAAGDFTLLEADNKSERVHFVLVKPKND